MNLGRDRFFLALRRRRGFVLAGFAVVFVLSALSSRSIVWHEDVADLLPTSDPVVRDYRLLFDTFRPADRTYVVVQAKAGTKPDLRELFSVADALAASFEKQVGEEALLRKVMYRVESEDVLAALNWMRRHRASYFSEEDQLRIEKSLEPEAIVEALAGWKKQFLTSPAPTLGARMAADPLGFDGLIASRFEDMRLMRGGVRVRDGRLVSREGDAVLVMAEPHFPATDSGHAEEWVTFLDATIAQALGAAPDSVRIFSLSGHRFSLENAANAKADIRTVATLSVIGVSILAYLALGRVGSVLFVLLPALFGATFSLGVLGRVWPGVSAITLGCGAMFVGISVDYGIHLLYHAADRRTRPDVPEAAIVPLTASRLLRPLGLSAGTTLGAFVVLTVSVLPGYRQLGAFAALGIFGAAAFTLLALPLMANAGSGVGWLHGVMGRRALAFRRTVAAHRRLVVTAMVVASCLAVVGVSRLKMEGDYRRLNGISAKSRSEWREVEQTFGALLESGMVLARGDTADAALETNERIAHRLEELRKRGHVESFRSIASIWPSDSTREANRVRWQGYWTEDRVARLRKDIESAARASGFRPESFDAFFEGLRAPLPSPAERAEVPGFLADAIDTQMARTPSGRYAVITALRLVDGMPLAPVVDLLREGQPEVVVASGRDFLQRMASVIARELVRAAVMAMAVVGFILWVVLRRLRRVGWFLLPVLLSVVWTLGLLGLAGVRINLVNSIVCAFIFGLVVDYCVFLLTAATEPGEHGDADFAAASGSVAMSALTTLLALGLWAWRGIRPCGASDSRPWVELHGVAGSDADGFVAAPSG